MRLIALFICIFTACLWGQTGHADIYVWIDENDVMHFTNQNPPAHAKVFMRAEEIPYDEAADNARREAERQQELLQAQAQIHEIEARLAEQQAEALQRIAEADRIAKEALERAEDLLESADDRYDSDRRYSVPYGYYPKNFIYRYYGPSKYHYRSRGGIYDHKSHKFRKGHQGFKRHGFSPSQDFRKRFRSSKSHDGGTHKKFSANGHDLRKRHFREGEFPRFGHQTGGPARFRGHHRGSFGKP